MTNEPENEFDRIEKQLGEGLGDDPRLSSGVPQEQRGSDIEFIQMSGLVRPSVGPSDALPPAPDDLDSSRPVSFFEKGVADVDADMVPGLVEDRATANQEIRPVPQSQAAMSHLRDIIADLTKDTPAATTDPALMAVLDAPEENVETPTELPPAPKEETEAEPAVSLEDMLSEFGSAHPMQSEAEAAPGPAIPIERAAEPVHRAATPEPVREVAPEPEPVGEVAPVVSPEPEPVREAAREPEPPRLTRPAPVLAGHSAELAEAEKLLGELEPDSLSAFEPSPADSEQTQFDLQSRTAEADEIPDEALDYKRQGKRRHRSTNKNPIGRSLARLAASLLVVTALAVATYTGYLWIQQRMVSSGQLFNQASRLAAKGEYASASQMFEDFASLHPNDPMRPEAQFNAAFTMQLQKPEDNDAAQNVRGQALRLFEQYRNDNPTHPKVARAETLMGRLNYESGRYAEAVELLRNPELRLRDPASAVPALRTLARASAKMGDAEAARSYYLQAVGVQGNHSPDVDYAELGSLYQSRADRAEDLDKRIELQQLAIESWTHALEVPGIDPASKQTIRSQLDVLRERLQSEPGMAPAMESLDEAAAEVNEAAAVAPEPAAPAAPSGVVEPTAETPASAPVAQAEPAPDAPAAAIDAHDVAPSAPSPAAASEPAAVEEGGYVVKQGDTLTSIAEAHHVTLDALKELNGLKGDTVFEGQHLLVPTAAP